MNNIDEVLVWSQEFKLKSNIPFSIHDFISTQEWSDKFRELIDCFLKPVIPVATKDNWLMFIWKIGSITKAWLPYRFENWTLYSWWMHHIIDSLKFWTTIAFPKPFDKTYAFSKMIAWWFKQEFFSLWSKSDDFFLRLSKHSSWEESNRILQSAFDMVVAHHLTELLRKDQKPDEYEKFISMIERLDFSEISEDNFESFMMLFNSNPELLWIWPTWFKVYETFQDELGIYEDTLEQVSVVRTLLPSNTILDAFIGVVYMNLEIYLYFSPVWFDCWFCTKDNLKINNNSAYIIFNFSEHIRSLIENIWVDIEFWNKNMLEKSISKNEMINSMITDLKKIINTISPDNVELEVSWVIQNKNRYNEINDKIKDWEIWFTYSGWEKQAIKFTIRDNLKNKKKRVQKELASYKDKKNLLGNAIQEWGKTS